MCEGEEKLLLDLSVCEVRIMSPSPPKSVTPPPESLTPHPDLLMLWKRGEEW